MHNFYTYSPSHTPPPPPHTHTATIISAKWKMYVNRKKYQQLRWASTVFATNWKRLQVQRYVAKYKKAVFVVRKFIIGFMNRSKPKCEENIYVSLIFIARLAIPVLVGMTSIRVSYRILKQRREIRKVTRKFPKKKSTVISIPC